jgi:hypothetical protein
MARELEGRTAGGDNSIPHPLGKCDVVGVTGGQIGTCLSNTDDWLLLVRDFLDWRLSARLSYDKVLELTSQSAIEVSLGVASDHV